MSNTNTGGPAFPCDRISQPDESVVSSKGMTLRDYFIAHAPEIPQPWFKPKMPGRKKAPEGRAAEWFKTLEGKAFLEADAAWKAEMEKQCFLQWPAAWADAMLKARAA